MFTVQSFGDAYERRARLAPAALVAVPLLVFLLLSGLSPLAAALPLLGSAGLLIWASDLTRQRGRVVERQLLEQWGGLPTTQLLRRGGDPARASQRRRNRRALAGFAHLDLPTKSEERADPTEADRRYESAVRSSFARLRHDPLGQVLQSENRSYGFRRNLYALRPLGLIVAIAAVLGDLVLLVLGVQVALVLLCLTAHLLLAAAWGFLVRAAPVREQADVLAEQFFVTITAAEATTSVRGEAS